MDTFNELDCYLFKFIPSDYNLHCLPTSYNITIYNDYLFKLYVI